MKKRNKIDMIDLEKQPILDASERPGMIFHDPLRIASIVIGVVFILSPFFIIGPALGITTLFQEGSTLWGIGLSAPFFLFIFSSIHDIKKKQLNIMTILLFMLAVASISILKVKFPDNPSSLGDLIIIWRDRNA